MFQQTISVFFGIMAFSNTGLTLDRLVNWKSEHKEIRAPSTTHVDASGKVHAPFIQWLLKTLGIGWYW